VPCEQGGCVVEDLGFRSDAYHVGDAAGREDFSGGLRVAGGDEDEAGAADQAGGGEEGVQAGEGELVEGALGVLEAEEEGALLVEVAVADEVENLQGTRGGVEC
jgi:hypothetical protein